MGDTDAGVQAPMTFADAIRKRPGMYVGDTSTGTGMMHLVLEAVANAADLHLAGRCSTITITVADDETVTVHDDGPGIPVLDANGQPFLETLFSKYSNRPTVDGHRPHVHLGAGGLGLCVVSALSERGDCVTVRDGVEAKISFARGRIIEPLAVVPTDRPSGTILRFRGDPQIFPHPRVPRIELTQRFDDLMFLRPGLTIRWSFAGDALARAGLAGRVALSSGHPVSHVASHRGSYDTARGPLDVEVALAWETQPAPHTPPIFDSFVNLERTRHDGSHVDGLRAGLAEFLGVRRRPRADHLPHENGLVGAIAVVLADVKYGTPFKDRLDTPEVKAPVADATRQALQQWATAHPDLLAALRDRLAND